MTGKVRPIVHRGERVFLAEGRDPLTGRRRRFYAATKAAAEVQQKKWNEEEAETGGEEPLRPACDAEVTVARYVEAYLAQRDPEKASTSRWKRMTFWGKENALLNHVLPFIIGPASATIGEKKVRGWHRRWLPLLA